MPLFRHSKRWISGRWKAVRCKLCCCLPLTDTKIPYVHALHPAGFYCWGCVWWEHSPSFIALWKAGVRGSRREPMESAPEVLRSERDPEQSPGALSQVCAPAVCRARGGCAGFCLGLAPIPGRKREFRQVPTWEKLSPTACIAKWSKWAFRCPDFPWML